MKQYTCIHLHLWQKTSRIEENKTKYLWKLFKKGRENLNFSKLHREPGHGPGDNLIYRGCGFRAAGPGWNILHLPPCNNAPAKLSHYTEACDPVASGNALRFTRKWPYVIVTTRLTVPSRIYRRFPFDPSLRHARFR